MAVTVIDAKGELAQVQADLDAQQALQAAGPGTLLDVKVASIFRTRKARKNRPSV